IRGDGATRCRSPESPWLSIVLVDALWSPAVTTRLAPSAPGRPQPAQVLDGRGEHERSAAPPIRRSRPGGFTPRRRGAPLIGAGAPWGPAVSINPSVLVEGRRMYVYYGAGSGGSIAADLPTTEPDVNRPLSSPAR